MKTIEVNLLGDLKQKIAPKKISAIPQVLTDKTATPEEAKNTLIIYSVGGAALVVLLGTLFVLATLLIWGYFINDDLSKVEDKILIKKAELAKHTKIKENMTEYKKDLVIKTQFKSLILKDEFPLPEVLEELRAKVPENVSLTGLTKSAKGVLIQGLVESESEKPLNEVSYFITNINNLKPEVSIVNSAVLAAAGNKTGTFTFSVKAAFLTAKDKEEAAKKKAAENDKGKAKKRRGK